MRQICSIYPSPFSPQEMLCKKYWMLCVSWSFPWEHASKNETVYFTSSHSDDRKFGLVILVNFLPFSWRENNICVKKNDSHFEDKKVAKKTIFSIQTLRHSFWNHKKLRVKFLLHLNTFFKKSIFQPHAQEMPSTVVISRDHCLVQKFPPTSS